MTSSLYNWVLPLAISNFELIDYDPSPTEMSSEPHALSQSLNADDHRLSQVEKR